MLGRLEGMALPDQKYLLETFRYDAERGLLFWKSRPHIRPSCNARRAGKAAGTVGQRGYLYVKLDGHLYGVHRLIWKMAHGSDPIEIDHADCDTSNNRLNNLRDSDRFTNTHNTKLSSANTSGHKGVSFHAQSKKWRARIRINGKTRDLGLYDDLALAALAYEQAAIGSFGEFARLR